MKRLPWNWLRFCSAGALLVLGACSRTVNTLPPLVRPDAQVREITLDLPAGLEIRSVDYNATMFSDVSGTSGEFGITSSSVGGRAFVKVYAVEQSTGQQVLLLYENVAQRAQPVQIIRFRSAPPLSAQPTRERP